MGQVYQEKDFISHVQCRPFIRQGMSTEGDVERVMWDLVTVLGRFFKDRVGTDHIIIQAVLFLGTTNAAATNSLPENKVLSKYYM